MDNMTQTREDVAEALEMGFLAREAYEEARKEAELAEMMVYAPEPAFVDTMAEMVAAGEQPRGEYTVSLFGDDNLPFLGVSGVEDPSIARYAEPEPCTTPKPKPKL